MYSVNIKEASQDFTRRQIVKIMDSDAVTPFNSVVEEGSDFVITPTGYAILEVHNDKAKGDKDYTRYVIVAEEGLYSTSSEPFFTKFSSIFDQMMFEEDFQLGVTLKPSKNYNGCYLTCYCV